MSKKYKLLDLFCGGGGCSTGYMQAGFEVVGVDLRSQPNYPYKMYRGDALEFLCKHGKEFDAIHASPPCQAHTKLAAIARKNQGIYHPDLIPATRELLEDSNRPYVIENVVGAPINDPLVLCGTMFGLKLYRHRLFETTFYVPAPLHPKHVNRCISRGAARPTKDQWYTVTGHFAGVEEVGRIMGLPHLGQRELAQAIPPAYTKYIGKYLLQHLSTPKNRVPSKGRP